MGCALLPKSREVYKDINSLLSSLRNSSPSAYEAPASLGCGSVVDEASDGEVDGEVETPSEFAQQQELPQRMFIVEEMLNEASRSPREDGEVEAASALAGGVHRGVCIRHVTAVQKNSGELVRTMKMQDVRLLVYGLGCSNQLMLDAQTQTLIRWLQLPQRRAEEVTQLNLQTILTSCCMGHYTLKKGTVKLTKKLPEVAVSRSNLFDPLISALFRGLNEYPQRAVSDNVARTYLESIMEPVLFKARSPGSGNLSWGVSAQGWKTIISHLMLKP